MNFSKFVSAIFICAFLTAIILGVVSGLYTRNERLSHDYAVTSYGKTYYIDDYTIEDGSIIFSIDGVEYHLSNYSIREIEK